MMADLDGVINFCVTCLKSVEVMTNNSVYIRPVDMTLREPDMLHSSLRSVPLCIQYNTRNHIKSFSTLSIKS